MLTFKKFTGINNVLPSERLMPEPRTGATALATALNVDVGLDGELRRRSGYSEIFGTCHKNLWQANGFMLATVDGGDLVAIAPDGAHTSIYFSLGAARVWYCNLPDGRTTFSNGNICGITDGATYTSWGVPVPSSIGAMASTAGLLDSGDYQYQLTYVRLSDDLESGPAYSNPVPVTGGISITGMPVLANHKINVYLTGANGDVAFFAGSTNSGEFAYAGPNDALVLPCRTEFLQPAPAGTVSAFWRGRVLTAVGSVLYASRTNQAELFDLRRDFKQFSAPITLVVPVDDGVYVGTEKELAFLSGAELDKMVYQRVANASVVLGSGVSVRGELVRYGDGPGQGSAMVCIADRVLVAGFNGGSVVRMTEGRYATDVTEVTAMFRLNDGVPQYVAVPL